MKQFFFAALATSYATIASADYQKLDGSAFQKFERCDGVVMLDQTSDNETHTGYTIFVLPDERIFFERYEGSIPVAYGTFLGDVQELLKMPEVVLEADERLYTYRSLFFEFARTPNWAGSDEKLSACYPENIPTT